MCLYIYVVALYFLYSSTDRIQRGVHDEPFAGGPQEGEGHYFHDHAFPQGELPAGIDPSKFTTWEQVMFFRNERYAKAQARPPMDGPGEHGEAVKLSPEEQKEADRLFKKEAFNIIASDKIALDRSIRDNRDPG